MNYKIELPIMFQALGANGFEIICKNPGKVEFKFFDFNNDTDKDVNYPHDQALEVLNNTLNSISNFPGTYYMNYWKGSKTKKFYTAPFIVEVQQQPSLAIPSPSIGGGLPGVGYISRSEAEQMVSNAVLKAEIESLKREMNSSSKWDKFIPAIGQLISGLLAPQAPAVSVAGFNSPPDPTNKGTNTDEQEVRNNIQYFMDFSLKLHNNDSLEASRFLKKMAIWAEENQVLFNSLRPTIDAINING